MNGHRTEQRVASLERRFREPANQPLRITNMPRDRAIAWAKRRGASTLSFVPLQGPIEEMHIADSPFRLCVAFEGNDGASKQQLRAAIERLESHIAEDALSGDE